ncbi:MAG: hypothetical protein JWO99_632 [Candidatus Saccharibacteria bacterium]|nr:hypothetical protein [Candidatus Saccharibacteria bacterium]
MVPPRPEFIPVGTPVRNSQPLELSYHDQQSLVQDMQQTGRELNNSPVAKPAFRKVVMERIPILGEFGESRSGDSLLVNFSEDNEGRHNALMQLYIGQVATRFQLGVSGDKWDVFAQGDRAPHDQIKNTDMAAILSSKLPNPRVLDAISDSAYFEGMMIPQLLANGLFEQVPQRFKEEHVVYTTNERVSQGLGVFAGRGGTPFVSPEYLAAVNTYLSIQEKSGTTTHQLVTRANFDVSGRQIQKEYAYQSEMRRSSYGKSIGHVAMSSVDGISREQVEEYARRDQERNEPISSLRRGLDNLRASQRLHKLAS